MTGTIDIFRFHRAVMDQYQSFSKSFVDIDDPQIEAALQDEGRLKSMWPEPLIQFNPSYESGADVDALVAEGVLSAAMASVFKGFSLHKHQECISSTPNTQKNRLKVRISAWVLFAELSAA